MAKSLNLNHVDTAVEGVSTLSLARDIINFGADYRVKYHDATSLVLTNMTAPVDKPESIKITVNPIKDIYKGSVIDPSLYGTSRRGVSLMCNLSAVYTVEDSVLGTSYDVPFACHIVVKTPADALITPSVIQDAITRMLGGLYESGSSDTTRIAALLRGSLVPSDL